MRTTPTDRSSNFYPDLYNPEQAAIFLSEWRSGPERTWICHRLRHSALERQILHERSGIAGRNGIPRGLVDEHWNTFAPRVGFAFDLTGHGKTVLRAGAELFYERLGGNEEYNMGQSNVPFVYRPQPDHRVPRQSGDQLHERTNRGRAVFPSSMMTVAPYKVPTAAQWSLGIQHQLHQSAVLSVAYVGNSNYHQSEGRNINTLAENDPNRLGVCGSTCGYTGIALNANLYRPYQGLGRHRPARNGGELQLQFATNEYAGDRVEESDAEQCVHWSHAFDIIDGELFANISAIPFNARYDYGPAGWDRRHISITSFIYNIPFFRNASSKAVRTGLGGWEFSGIATFESGTPFSVAAGPDNLGYGGGTANRADIVSPVTYPKTRFQWFSTASFQRPGPLAMGHVGEEYDSWSRTKQLEHGAV